jgi:hypothetical protein
MLGVQHSCVPTSLPEKVQPSAYENILWAMSRSDILE